MTSRSAASEPELEGNDAIASLGTTNSYFLSWTERHVSKTELRTKPDELLQQRLVTGGAKWPSVNTALAFCPATCRVPTFAWEHVLACRRTRQSRHRSAGPLRVCVCVTVCAWMTSGTPCFVTTWNPFRAQGLCRDVSSWPPKQHRSRWNSGNSGDLSGVCD